MTLLTDRGAHVIADVLIINTQVVCPFRSTVPSYYEIHVAPSADAPICVLVTRDRALYDTAVHAEGTTARFDCEWAPRSKDRALVQQLVALWRVA